MSNERYLIISYFVVGVLSLGVGIVAYLALATPFAAIAETVAGKIRGKFLKRAMAVCMTSGAVLGFLSVSYTTGCLSYEQMVKNRDYLIHINQLQMQNTGSWIISAVFLWCVVVLLCLAALRNREPKEDDRE